MLTFTPNAPALPTNRLDEIWIQKKLKGDITGPFNRLLLAAILLLLFGNSSVSFAQSTFDERADYIINRYKNTTDTYPKQAFWYAQAKFYDYEVNGNSAKLDEARTQVSAALDRFNDDDPSFQLWGAMDCYLRWSHLYGDALKTKTKNAIVNSTNFGSHNTQNKEMMAATARYLAQETWPDATFASSYSTSDLTGKTTLLKEMTEYVHMGEQEHNSYTYYALHYGSMRSLGDFAKNAEMKTKGGLTAEWLLISAAGEWFNGHWAAAAERVYRPFREQGQYEAGTAHLWIHFGGPSPKTSSAELHNSIQTAVSQYRLPKMVVDIANDRDQPFIHREKHNHLVSNARYFYLTSYMNKTYALFSQHEELPNWPNWMASMLRWGVCWNKASGKSIFFVQHPNINNKNGSGVARKEGETKHGQVLQHQKALIGVYDIPSNDPLPYLKGYVPTNYDAAIDNSSTGRIYLHYGSVMISFYLSKGFNWNGGMDTLGVNQPGKIGMVVETALPADYAGATPTEQLTSFKNAILNNTQVTTTGITNTNPKLVYRALDGTTLETTYNSQDRTTNYDKINGSLVDYSSWPLLESKPLTNVTYWIKQSYDSNILTLQYGGDKRIYDFGNWTVSTNLALNKPVYAASQEPGNGAVNAVDNSVNTRWSADGAGYPRTLRVDLGKTYSINRTELDPYLDRAYQYKIEVSTDGNTYTTVVDKTGNTTGGSVLTDNFTSVNARYVLLRVTGAYNYTGGWVSVNEFRVFGKEVGAGARLAYQPQGGAREERETILYPNPARNEVQVRYTASESEPVEVTIVDALGNTCLQVTQAVEQGTHTFPLAITRLASGSYLVRLRGKHQQLVHKLLVVH